jgi:hypothetical protein
MGWDPETAGTARLEAEAIMERQRAKLARERERRATVPQPDSDALARGLAEVIRRADSLTVAADSSDAEVLAELVRDLAEMLRSVAAMAMEGAVAAQALNQLAGTAVKRLPAWAMRQAPEAQRWLAQLPQEALDSPYLERSFEAMALGGFMANEETLVLLAARVADQEDANRRLLAQDTAFCTACAESHERPVATASEPCPLRGGFSGVRS